MHLDRKGRPLKLNEILYSADQVICSLLHAPDPTIVNKVICIQKGLCDYGTFLQLQSSSLLCMRESRVMITIFYAESEYISI